MASRRKSSGASASVKRADQRYLGRSSPPHDIQFVGSRGSYVQGADGRRYVDFIAGGCVGNPGALADRCRKAGLLLGIDDDTLTLFPALTLSRRTVHEGLDILERCL